MQDMQVTLYDHDHLSLLGECVPYTSITQARTQSTLYGDHGCELEYSRQVSFDLPTSQFLKGKARSLNYENPPISGSHHTSVLVLAGRTTT